MSSRFYIPPEQITNQQFVMRGSEARHAVRVLRKKVGDEIQFFDGKDLSYTGRIEHADEDEVRGVIIATSSTGTARTPVVLYQALIKGPRWDWLVEKASELGAARLVPMITTRTVAKSTSDHALERWRRIATESAKQCGRLKVMELSSVIDFSAAISGLPAGGISFIPWEKESKITIRQRFAKGAPVFAFIGPEGGWEGREVEAAERAGVIPVTLGTTLLRAETAGLVAVSQIMTEIGDQ